MFVVLVAVVVVAVVFEVVVELIALVVVLVEAVVFEVVVAFVFVERILCSGFRRVCFWIVVSFGWSRGLFFSVFVREIR